MRMENISSIVVIDPVCGMTIDPRKSMALDYKGKKWNFCSAGCRTKFLADPERYIRKSGSNGESHHAHRNSEHDAPGNHAETAESNAGFSRDEDDPGSKEMRFRFWVCAALTALLLQMTVGQVVWGDHLTLFSSAIRKWIELALSGNGNIRVSL